MTEAASRIPEDACIHELFEIQAGLTPSATAVLCGNDRLAYRDLNRRANQLASLLADLGVTRETIVGVCLERSLDAVVALLGVLKAGAAYLPLDPGYPAARLAFMLEDSRAEIVLTDSRSAARVPDAHHTIRLDTDEALLDCCRDDNVARAAAPGDPAYVIYTSGSTGRPKGVVGLHRGAVNRFAWMWRAWPFAADAVCCQKTSLGFVDSVAELFVPLPRGVPTVIVPDEVAKDPSRLVDLLASARVTRLVLVPSLLRDLLEVGGVRERLRHLRVCVSSGEALPLDLCRRFRVCLPDAVLLNLYGSTEVSADVACYDTRELPPGASTVPLGRPIDHTSIYILDEGLQPVPDGTPGEIHVAGRGLARGYWGQPELTRERFLPDPFADAPHARMYRTGDRGRLLADGNVEFLGRVDRQVKIRGHRVELSEIEEVLCAHPAVAQAVVTTQQSDAADHRVVAYVVASDMRTIAVDGLRGFCRQHLPEHMLPAAFVQLRALPLTPSGKVDRLALPVPRMERALIAGRAAVAPRTEAEQRLAAIWRELLGFEDVGVTDDFFDVGGHSLLAVRMFLEIEAVFGRRLSVSALVEAPTIERLAHMLAQPDEPEAWSPLVELQRLGSRRPFFLVHGIGGEVLSFAPLARHLAPDQPVYGLRAQGSDGRREPHTDIQSMAASYIDAIRTVAPDGPYLLGGYSSGGTVALEMARQLRADGDAVGVLAMIDSEAPGAEEASAWDPRTVGAYVRNLASWIVDDDFFRSSADDKLARLRSRGRLLRSRVRSFILSEKDGADIRDILGVWRVPPRHRAFLETHARALATYEPRPYDGPMTLIRARTLRLTAWSPPDLGWRRFAKGGLDIRMVPGAHDNILTEPRVKAVAQQLRKCLAAAEPSRARTA
jgi:amino acid adenylation domain-containing protein